MITALIAIFFSLAIFFTSTPTGKVIFLVFMPLFYLSLTYGIASSYPYVTGFIAFLFIIGIAFNSKKPNANNVEDGKKAQSNNDPKTALTAKEQAERDAKSALAAKEQAERDAKSALVAKEQAERDAKSALATKEQAERDAKSALVAKEQAERDAKSALATKEQAERDVFEARMNKWKIGNEIRLEQEAKEKAIKKATEEKRRATLQLEWQSKKDFLLHQLKLAEKEYQDILQSEINVGDEWAAKNIRNLHKSKIIDLEKKLEILLRENPEYRDSRI